MRRIAFIAAAFAITAVGWYVAPPPARAEVIACDIGTKCTYYYNDNSTEPGKCGHDDYGGTVFCNCTADGHSQEQGGCDTH